MSSEPTRPNEHVEGEPQQSAITGGASSAAESDVEISANDTRLQPTVRAKWGLDMCDELDECNVYVNHGEGDYADEVTGGALLRDDVAKARMEEMSCDDKFEAYEEVTNGTMRARRKPISCRWRDINKGDSERVELRSRLVAFEIKQKGTDSYFAGTPSSALARYVVSRTATRTKTGDRRQPLVLDAKRAFLHADALTETYRKPTALTRH